MKKTFRTLTGILSLILMIPGLLIIPLFLSLLEKDKQVKVNNLLNEILKNK